MCFVAYWNSLGSSCVEGRYPLAVGRPSGRGVIARIGRDLRRVGPFVQIARGNGPDVFVIGCIGVWLGAVARERDEFAVRRPAGTRIVVIA